MLFGIRCGGEKDYLTLLDSASGHCNCKRECCQGNVVAIIDRHVSSHPPVSAYPFGVCS